MEMPHFQELAVMVCDIVFYTFNSLLQHFGTDGNFFKKDIWFVCAFMSTQMTWYQNILFLEAL